MQTEFGGVGGRRRLSNSAGRPFERRWVSAKEAGTYLGLHPQTVFDLCRRGVISRVRIGGSRRIDLRKLDVFLEGQIERQARRKG